MSDILLYFNLLFVPLYCIYRFKKKKCFSFLNPCFYLLISSYFYLTVSSFLLTQYLDNFSYIELFRFKSASVEATNLICNWFTFVFLIFYMLSSEQKNIVSKFKPKANSYLIALIFTGIISLILAMIIVTNASTLLSFETRLESFEFYVEEILIKYKVGVLVNILLASLTVIVWRTKNFKWYLVLLLPIVLDFLAKGRTMSFFCVVYAYINYVTITQKPRITAIATILLMVILSGFFREEFVWSWDSLAIGTFSEVILTRFTTILTYDHFLNEGDMFPYLLQSLFSSLPESISEILVDSQLPYTLEIGEFAVAQVQNPNFSGLAGNLVSEALFYGGITFSIISPLIIGSVFYLINKLRVYKTFPGFTFFCFLIASLQQISRTSFYDQFFGTICLMFTSLIWITIFEDGRIIFKKAKKLKMNF